MPRLDLYANFKLFVKVRLPDRDFLIGRGVDCDLQLPNEAVSRHHVRIATESGGHWVHNLSPNGTRVNAGMVEAPQELQAGDRIYVENAVFIYQPDEAAAAEIDRRQTMLKMRALPRGPAAG